MNKYRILALALVFAWAFVVMTFVILKRREYMENVPAPSDESIFGQVTLLSNRVSAAEENIKSLQVKIDGAAGDVEAGKIAVAAAQGGIQSTLPG